MPGSEIYYMGGDPEFDLDFGADDGVYIMGGEGENTTEFGGMFGKIGHFISNAAKCAGREMGKAASKTVNGIGKVGKAITKIPIVGGPLNTIFSAAYNLSMGPMVSVTQAAVTGKRIDKAFVKSLKTQVQSIKAVAPYVQTVLSVVPGVGTGISAALGAGLALASGQRIDQALMAGAMSALPGGPLVKAAASAAAEGVIAAAKGEKFNVQSVAGKLLNVLPIPAAAKTGLASAMDTVGRVARGEKVGKAISEAALGQITKVLPPAVAKAYQTGLAMGTAVVVQGKRAAELASPAVLNKLVEAGIQNTKAVPALTEARKLVGPGVRGFDLAQGVLAQQSKPADITQIRSTIKTPAELQAFDMGLAARIGLVTQPPRGKLSPAAQAGRAITHGIQGMSTAKNKVMIMKAVVANPSAAVGAKEAVIQISKGRDSWFLKILYALGLGPKTSSAVPTVAPNSATVAALPKPAAKAANKPRPVVRRPAPRALPAAPAAQS